MSGHQHELFMMALTAVLSIIVGFLAGRIWQAWCAIVEETELSRDEVAMINADRLRRRREAASPRKVAASTSGLSTLASRPKQRAASVN